MLLDEFTNLRRNDVVTAASVSEHAQLIVHVFWTIDANRYADVVLRDEVDDRWREKRSIRCQAEAHRARFNGRLLLSVRDDLFQQSEVHQRLATEERDLDRAPRRLLKQQIH